MNVYVRAFGYFRPFFLPTLGGVSLTLVAIAFNLLRPWPFKFIVDGVLDTSKGTSGAREFVHHWFGDANPGGAVLGLSVAMVVIGLMAGLVNLGSNYLFIRVGLRALLKVRTELYAALQSLPLKFHDSRRSADSSFRVAYDSQSIPTARQSPSIAATSSRTSRRLPVRKNSFEIRASRLTIPKW